VTKLQGKLCKNSSVADAGHHMCCSIAMKHFALVFVAMVMTAAVYLEVDAVSIIYSANLS